MTRLDRAPRARRRARPHRAEVDPDLEITEIVDRAVKAGGPALLFENPKGASHPLLINQFGTERRMCLAFGVERLDDLADKLAELSSCSRRRGSSTRCARSASSSRSPTRCPKEVSKAPCQEVVLTGDDVDLDAASDPALLAARPGAVHHAARRDHEGPRTRASATSACTGCRRSTGARRSCTGRSTRTGAPTCSPRPTARSRSPSRSASTRSPRTRRARRCRSTSASSWSPASSRARRSSSSSARRSTSRCPRTPRSCSRAGSTARRRRHRGPVRRPHRLLHAGRGVPDLPHQRDHDAPRRDLPVDRRRQAAGRGRVAREGDRADLPAGDPDERPRDRRLRPADGGRVPQLRASSRSASASRGTHER